jgi:hypothetical protein
LWKFIITPRMLSEYGWILQRVGARGEIVNHEAYPELLTFLEAIITAQYNTTTWVHTSPSRKIVPKQQPIDRDESFTPFEGRITAFHETIVPAPISHSASKTPSPNCSLLPSTPPTFQIPIFSRPSRKSRCPLDPAKVISGSIASPAAPGCAEMARYGDFADYCDCFVVQQMSTLELQRTWDCSKTAIQIVMSSRGCIIAGQISGSDGIQDRSRFRR